MSSRKSSRTIPKFHVGDDYEVIRTIGEGAYGVVVSATHKPTGRSVAIKRVIPLEHNLFAIRTLREIKMLKFFSTEAVNENIISILDIIPPPKFEDFKEIYIVQELMQTDLHRIIRTQPITDDHCQYFIYQILRGLKTIHSADLVHRDLKPANCLVNANCDLKICDFGLARSIQSKAQTGKDAGMMTEYVATRWYRAPEIMLSFKMYTKSVDIWAVGCILGELLTKRPLFPGRDYSHQLDLILDVIGTPSLEEFYAITSRRSRDYIRALPIRKRQSLASMFPQASAEAVDFLAKTLTFDPKKRMDVDEALRHPYLAAYHDADDEPAARPLSPTCFEFDLRKDDLKREDLKELLYNEVKSFESLI